MDENSNVADRLEYVKVKSPQEVIRENLPQLYEALRIPKDGISVIRLLDENKMFITLPKMLITLPKVSFWEMMWMFGVNEFKYRLFSVEQTISNTVIMANQGVKPMDTSFIETIKGFLSGMLVRWLLKIGGGFILSVGITEGSVAQIASAVVAIVVGLLISLIQQKKAVLQTPPVA